MKVKLSCGSRHQDIEIIDGENALTTLGELREIVSTSWNLDSSCLKMIHRGSTIMGADDCRLEDRNFKENDKILVLGKAKVALKDDPGFSMLVKYEKDNLLSLQNQCEENGKDLTELEKNFLDKEKSSEMIKRMDKRLKTFSAVSEKHLETIDGLKIITEATPEDQAVRNREKRKALIDGVLQLLNQSDKYSRRLEEYTMKLNGEIVE